MARGDHYPQSDTKGHKRSYLIIRQFLCLDQSCMKDQGADAFEEILTATAGRAPSLFG